MFPRITPVYTTPPTTIITITTENDDNILQTSSSPSSLSSSSSSAATTPILLSRGSGLTTVRSAAPAAPTAYDTDEPVIPIPTSATELQIDWSLMQSVLVGISAKIGANSSNPSLRFAEKTVEYLQQLHQQLPLTDFLTVLDQLIERTAAQPRPLTQDGLDAMVRSLTPLPCGVPANELAQAILLKVWPPEYNYMLQMSNSNNNNNNSNSIINNSNENINIDLSGFVRVFSLSAARTTIATADARLFNGELCQNESVLKFLCDLYGTDPLGFWSIFDQLCSRCLLACQQGLMRPDGVSATFLACCGTDPVLAPIDATLSPVIAASVPQHPMLPYPYPPHYLRKPAFVAYMQSAMRNGLVPSILSAASPMLLSSASSSSSSPVSASPVCEGVRSRSPSPACYVSAAVGEGGRTYLSDPDRFRRLRKEECADIDAFYPYTWRAALLIFDEIERKLNGSNKRCICFDDKHKQNLRKKWEEDPKGFFSIIDQIFEKLVQTNWNAVRDEARYVQSLIAKFVPQTVVSRLIQSYITPPEVAAAMIEA